MDRVNQWDYKSSTMAKPQARSVRGIEICLAAALLVWRFAANPAAAYWKDWMLLLGLFWLYTTFQSSSPAWPAVLLSVMAYLLGIYVLGQIPHALAVLGVGV
jgi:hypothetical protein